MTDAIISPEEIDDFIILRARAFTAKVRRAMVRDILNDAGITLLEWQLLFSVARFGSCHLAHITRHTSIDPAHGSRAATTLEKKRFITRREDPENRRRKLISLTPEGAAMIRRIWPQARSMMADVTDQLGRNDLEALKSLLDSLNAAAEPLAHRSKEHRAPTEEALTTA